MSLEETIKRDSWNDVKVAAFGGLNKAFDPDNLEHSDLVRAENLRLVDDTIKPAIGYSAYHDTTDNDAWVGDGMRPFRYKLLDGTLGQLLFTTRGLYRDNGSAWISVSGGTFTGTVADRFSVVSLPWSTEIVFTNGFDPVQVYDTADGTIENLTGPGGAAIYAKALAIFDNSLILLNTVENGTPHPQRIRYCDQADITNWDAGTAGFIDLLQRSEPILCGRLLSSYLIIYREIGIHRLAISSNPNKRFEEDMMIPDNGVLSIDSVINVEKNRHFVWGRDNFYLYDGGFELEPIGDPITKIVFEPLLEDASGGDEMFSGEDPDEARKHHLVYLEQLGEILAVYQSFDTDDLECALLYRYQEKKWFTRKFSRPVRGADAANAFIHLAWEDLEGTWDDLEGSWSDLISEIGSTLPIFASTLGGTSSDTPTYQFDVDLVNDLNVDFRMVLETKDYSEYPYNARLDWVDLRINATQEVVVEFSIDEGVTWDILRAFTTSGLQIVRLHRQILYESLRLRISGDQYELKSMNLRVTPEDEMAGEQPSFANPNNPTLVAVLNGTDVDLTMSATRGSMAIDDFLIFRSLDGDDFVQIATQAVETVNGTSYAATYTDEDPPFVGEVEYYVVARDTLLNLSEDSNIEDLPDGTVNLEDHTLEVKSNEGATLPQITFGNDGQFSIDPDFSNGTFEVDGSPVVGNYESLDEWWSIPGSLTTPEDYEIRLTVTSGVSPHGSAEQSGSWLALDTTRIFIPNIGTDPPSNSVWTFEIRDAATQTVIDSMEIAIQGN